MDLYRFFHPHHNPRLRSKPVRLQELAELELAASEIEKALKRAKVRTESSQIGGILPEHFDELIQAANFIAEVISTLIKSHPGDNLETMNELLRERIDAPGWENWARLLRQRLELLRKEADYL